jgi:putative serine protease PepD
VSDEIIADGKASHGLLGASVGDAASATNSTTVGAVISDVSSGGAAEKAGLQKGDVITNFNNVPITGATDLTAQVRALAAGAKAEVTYVRDGKSMTVDVTLGELSS